METYIKRYFDREVWKQVELKYPFSEKYELFVSNYGNVKRISLKNGIEKILKLHLTEGYPATNLTVIGEIAKKDNLIFIKNRLEISELQTEIKSITKEMIFCGDDEEKRAEFLVKLNQTRAHLNKLKESYKKRYLKNQIKRKKTFGNLVHRLVARYFNEKPSEEHNLVAHKDYDKFNNHHSNLIWMTREQNVKHQKGSPYVIKSKIISSQKTDRVTRAKLTINQVMLIKKRMNEDVSLRELSKRYKVTETQLLRIKRGINWSNIPAAL